MNTPQEMADAINRHQQELPLLVGASHLAVHEAISMVVAATSKIVLAANDICLTHMVADSIYRQLGIRVLNENDQLRSRVDLYDQIWEVLKQHHPKEALTTHHVLAILRKVKKN